MTDSGNAGAARRAEARATGRTVRSSRTFLASLAFTAATIALGFLTTPFLLRALGAERYGAFRALNDVLVYLVLVDYGFCVALEALYARALVSSRRDVGRTMTAGLLLYGWVTAAILLAGAGLVWWIPGIVPVQTVPQSEVRIAAGILVGSLILLPTSVFRAWLEASQRGYIIHSILTVQSISTTVGLLLAAIAGWGLAGQAGVTATFQAAGCLCFLYYGWEADLRLASKAEAEPIRRELLKLNWPTLFYQLTNKMSFLSDTVFVSALVGASAVAPFYLTQRLATIAQAQLQNAGSAVWAGLVELWHRGEADLFRSRFLELTAIVAGAGMAVLVPIAAFNHHFLRHWVGSVNDAGSIVAILAALNGWMLALYTLWSFPVIGIGMVRALAPVQGIATAANVAVTVPATLAFGLAGPLLGTTTAFTLIYPLMLTRILHEHFHVEPGALWMPLVRQLRWGAAWSLLLWLYAHRVEHLSFFSVLAHMAVFFAAGLAICWMAGLTPAERERLMAVKQAILSRS